MDFPKVQEFDLVVAALDEEGHPDFLPVGPPAVIDDPGVVEAAMYWTVTDGHGLKNPGKVPSEHPIAASANGSTFGVNRFPAHSAGKIDLTTSAGSMGTTGQNGDPGMHATETIDYEIILSGKVDIELPGGKIRTLRPGSLLVMNGVPHAWKNRYAEDCVYIAVTIAHNIS